MDGVAERVTEEEQHIIIQAAVNGAPAFGPDLFTNGPSTINPSEAGFRPALVGTVYLILGVIVLVVPLGVGAAIYLEEYADREKWWNRMIELNGDRCGDC